METANPTATSRNGKTDESPRDAEDAHVGHEVTDRETGSAPIRARRLYVEDTKADDVRDERTRRDRARVRETTRARVPAKRWKSANGRWLTESPGRLRSSVGDVAMWRCEDAAALLLLSETKRRRRLGDGRWPLGPTSGE